MIAFEGRLLPSPSRGSLQLDVKESGGDRVSAPFQIGLCNLQASRSLAHDLTFLRSPCLSIKQWEGGVHGAGSECYPKSGWQRPPPGAWATQSPVTEESPAPSPILREPCKSLPPRNCSLSHSHAPWHHSLGRSFPSLCFFPPTSCLWDKSQALRLRVAPRTFGADSNICPCPRKAALQWPQGSFPPLCSGTMGTLSHRCRFNPNQDFS